MAEKLGMEFRTKLNWDGKFSPIRNKEFVRAQTGEQPVTRDEFEEKHGHKYLSDICLQLWDDPQINWDGKNTRLLPKLLGPFRRERIYRRSDRERQQREDGLCPKDVDGKEPTSRRHPMHHL